MFDVSNTSNFNILNFGLWIPKIDDLQESQR